MRTLLFVVSIVLLASCEEKKTPVLNPYLRQYAGQYLIHGTGEDPKLASERFVFSVNGHAEWHRLVKDPGIGQFKLEEIKAGTWSADSAKIRVAIKNLWENETITFGQHDSVWQEDGNPGKRISLLVAF